MTRILLHGFAGSPAMWDPMLEALAAAEKPNDLSKSGKKLGPSLIGYSMGARRALQIMAERPDFAARVTLIGVHPGLEDPAERAARVVADERWARMLETDGIERFADAWGDQAIFCTQTGEQREAQRRVRLAQDPGALAATLRTFGLGRMPSYWHVVARAHLIVGEKDVKFREIAARTGARVTVIPGAGHNVPLEQPAALAAVLAREESAGKENEA